MTIDTDQADVESVLASMIRNSVLGMIEQHEAVCPGTGNPCWQTRCSLIGLLCHSLGIRGDAWWNMLRRETEEYDRLCVKNKCHPPTQPASPESEKGG